MSLHENSDDLRDPSSPPTDIGWGAKLQDTFRSTVSSVSNFLSDTPPHPMLTPVFIERLHTELTQRERDRTQAYLEHRLDHHGEGIGFLAEKLAIFRALIDHALQRSPWRLHRNMHVVLSQYPWYLQLSEQQQQVVKKYILTHIPSLKTN